MAAPGGASGADLGRPYQPGDVALTADADDYDLLLYNTGAAITHAIPIVDSPDGLVVALPFHILLPLMIEYRGATAQIRDDLDMTQAVEGEMMSLNLAIFPQPERSACCDFPIT